MATTEADFQQGAGPCCNDVLGFEQVRLGHFLCYPNGKIQFPAASTSRKERIRQSSHPRGLDYRVCTQSVLHLFSHLARSPPPVLAHFIRALGLWTP